MKKRIMVVDDAKFIRVILTDILEEAGYEVVGEAENGVVALEKYPKLKPDLMLLDIIMPEMEGNVVLGKLMKDYPDAKVLIISAVGQRFLVEKALKSGAAGYIVKPIDPANVLAQVEKIIGPAIDEE